jgi:hypothetical protein
MAIDYFWAKKNGLELGHRVRAVTISTWFCHTHSFKVAMLVLDPPKVQDVCFGRFTQQMSIRKKIKVDFM